MKKKVILTYLFFPDLVKKAFGKHFKIQLVHSRNELKKEIKSAHGLVCLLLDSIDKELLALAKNLKAVGNCAVGVDNIDLKECKVRGIKIVNTPDVLTRATAELALTLLMSVARRVTEGQGLCRSGRFNGWRPDLLLGQELKGRQAVIVGKGRIGKETAKIFKAFGLKIKFIIRQHSDSEINNTLKKAEILSIHLPLNSETRHWLSRKRIAILPHSAIVINTSRGPLIDEKALTQALTKKKIYGAGLDVYELEPKISKKLRSLSNTVLLPHLGSATLETRRKMQELALNGVASVLKGKRPKNLLQPVHI